jgi:hypothetical protein
MNADTLTGSEHIMSYSADYESVGWAFRGVSNYVNFFTGDGATKSANTATLTAGTWYHIAGMKNSSSTCVYVDANLITCTASGNILSTSGGNTMRYFIAGCRKTDGADCWDGRLDEIKIFNRSLSADEIRAEYNIGKEYIWSNDILAGR